MRGLDLKIIRKMNAVSEYALMVYPKMHNLLLFIPNPYNVLPKNTKGES